MKIWVSAAIMCFLFCNCSSTKSKRRKSSAQIERIFSSQIDKRSPLGNHDILLSSEVDNSTFLDILRNRSEEQHPMSLMKRPTPKRSNVLSAISSMKATGSCRGRCGKSSTDCYCDEACLSFGDCCDDYTSRCVCEHRIYFYAGDHEICVPSNLLLTTNSYGGIMGDFQLIKGSRTCDFIDNLNRSSLDYIVDFHDITNIEWSYVGNFFNIVEMCFPSEPSLVFDISHVEWTVGNNYNIVEETLRMEFDKQIQMACCEFRKQICCSAYKSFDNSILYTTYLDWWGKAIEDLDKGIKIAETS